MNKKIKIITLIIISLLGMFFISKNILKAEKVNVFIIERKINLKEIVKESGIVESQKKFSISPAFDGEIYTKAKIGEVVKKGQIIAQLNTEDISSAITQVESEIKSINAQINITGPSNPQNKEIEVQKINIETLTRNSDKITKDYERINKLYDLGAASKVEVEIIENELKLIKDELRVQKELLNTMENNSYHTKAYYNGKLQNLQAQKSLLISKKGKTNITSPVDGIITAITINDMQKVNTFMNIMEISAIDQKVLNSQLASEVAADLKVGDEVEVIYETKHNKQTYKGQIRYISPYSSTQLSSLGIEEQKTRVETIFNELNKISLGYKLDINFITLEKNDVIAIPKLSMFKEDINDYVFKIKDDKVLRQEIKKGIETSNEIEVLEGLEVGDIILLDPNNKNIKEGSKVTY